MYLQIQFQLIFPSRRHKSLFLQFFPKLIINGSASLFPRHPQFFKHPSSMIIAGISKRHPLNGLIKNSNGALPRFSPGFNITTSHLPFSISPVFRCATRLDEEIPSYLLFSSTEHGRGNNVVLEIGVALATGVFDKQTDVGVSLIKIYRDLD